MARRPKLAPLVGARFEVAAEKDVEATAGEAELVGRLSGRQGALPKAFENMPDERAWVPMEELLVLFRTAEDTTRTSPSGQSFRPPSLRSGFLKDWPEGLYHWRYGRRCPALLTTESVLLCFPHDRRSVCPSSRFLPRLGSSALAY